MGTNVTTNPQYYDETAAFFGENRLYFIIAGVVALILLAVALAGVWQLFKKASEKPWKSLVPIYNTYLLFLIADLNPWLSLLLYVPLANLVVFILFALRLPRAFSGTTSGFSALIIFFPWIALPLLGFSSKYTYEYTKGKNIPFAAAFTQPSQKVAAEPPSVAEPPLDPAQPPENMV